MKLEAGESANLVQASARMSLSALPGVVLMVMRRWLYITTTFEDILEIAMGDGEGRGRSGGAGGAGG